MKFITLSFKRMTWPVLGAAFLLAFGATNAAQAKWQAYFIASTATTCQEMYVEMDSQFGTGYSGQVYADIELKGIDTGDYFDSFPSPTQWIHADVSPDRTSFTWFETTFTETGDPNAGFNMVCLKAGNGRTCWHTQFDKESAPTQVFTDLNTTSKIGNAWICSDSARLPATGGPDCPSYSGESLYQLFEGVQSPEALITVYDGASVETCAAPAPEPTTTEVTRTIRQCNDANSFYPIGPTGPNFCDPRDPNQNCCRVDDVCISELDDPTNLGQIIANCTNYVGGPPASNGYAKGGDNSCFYSYSSGSGGISMVCY